MDNISIVLGILFIVSGILSFILTLVDLKDKRKKIFGLRVRDIKRYAAYISLFLFVATFALQTKKNIEDSIAQLKKERKEDSTANAHFQETVANVKRNIDSTSQVLEAQKNEIDSQLIILKNQREALKKSALILQSVGYLSDSVNKTIDLTNQNLEQQKGMLVLQDKLQKQYKKLATPLSDVYFSFELQYDSANIIFPQYYVRMEDIYMHRKDNDNTPGLVFNTSFLRIDTKQDFEPPEKGLQDVRAAIMFCEGEDYSTIPLLSYYLYAWTKSQDVEKKSSLEKGIIKCLIRSADYHIKFDFEKKTLTQTIDYASYEQINNQPKILSASDIVYPDNPSNKYIVFKTPTANFYHNPPKLIYLNINYGEGSDCIVSIPESRLKKELHAEDSHGSSYNIYSINVKELQDDLHVGHKDIFIPGYIDNN